MVIYAKNKLTFAFSSSIKRKRLFKLCYYKRILFMFFIYLFKISVFLSLSSSRLTRAFSFLNKYHNKITTNNMIISHTMHFLAYLYRKIISMNRLFFEIINFVERNIQTKTKNRRKNQQ
jgi:hypothetical protein